ncbi:MAG: LCP family protein [Clostridia bacterium]|nr:LCP family protein [Clostridia bacterium]MBQ3006244.1 LCP family protein [Clostridia bacterium]
MEDIYISKRRQNINDFQITNQDMPPMPPQQQPPEKKPKKKKHGFLKAIAVFVLAVFLFTSVFIFVFAAASGYTRNDLEKNEYVSSYELKSSPLVSNILLMGVDGSADSASRSDSMILVSLDYMHGKIKLTSFLRDSWVEIPSKGKKAKLNAACTYGGPQLVVDTIEYNFGVDIDHYVMVDFEMFTDIIDSLGGIDVEVTSKEAKFINRTTRHTVESGESVHLNGDEALVYCRIRKLDSDYMRTYRQRKVITALIGQARSAGIDTLLSAMKDVFPMIETDMSAAEITALAYKGGFGVLAFDIEQNRVPTDEHMYPDTISGQWVEVVDIDATKDYLREYIYTNNISVEDEE